MKYRILTLFLILLILLALIGGCVFAYITITKPYKESSTNSINNLSNDSNFIIDDTNYTDSTRIDVE